MEPEGLAAGWTQGRRSSLPPGQRVCTAEGYRPIAEVEAGEAVISGTGRRCLVLRRLCWEVEEPLVRLQTAGGQMLRATGAHPVLARRGDGPAAWWRCGLLLPGDRVAVRGPVVLPDWPRAGHWGLLAQPAADARAPGPLLVAEEQPEGYAVLDWVLLLAVDALPYAGPVCDLTLAEEHTYLADGIVVADGTCPPPGEGWARGEQPL